jgi:hypothetical protein
LAEHTERSASEVPLKPNISRHTSAELALNTFQQLLEKIQKLDASIEVLKGALAAGVLREDGPEAKEKFLSVFADAEQQALRDRRLDTEKMLDGLRVVLQYGSLPDA